MQPPINNHELITKLKMIREENGLSLQNIYDLLEASNNHLCINSIKKVFADGSELEHFRFHDTLQPIARVLLGIYGSDQGNESVDALHAEICEKDRLIEQLERDHSESIMEYRRCIEYLKHQVAVKDQRIDDLTDQIRTLIEKL